MVSHQRKLKKTALNQNCNITTSWLKVQNTKNKHLSSTSEIYFGLFTSIRLFDHIDQCQNVAHELNKLKKLHIQNHNADYKKLQKK